MPADGGCNMPADLLSYLFTVLISILGIVLGGFLLVVLGVACSSLPGLGLGSVMLECPHCGRQTPSHLPDCKHCGRSFREEVAEERPRVEPPKLRR